MLPRGYNPANYDGKVLWNEESPIMQAVWGTQEDYNKHLAQGGTWEEYQAAAQLRLKELERLMPDEDTNENTVSSKKR